jgi:DNA-directed RNA polymerase subunit RPC12/RpoP
MPNPVCVKCGREFKIKKNGVMVLETTGPTGDPYKIWNTDLWECPKCYFQILHGYGSNPVAYQGDPDFEELRKMVEIIFY